MDVTRTYNISYKAILLPTIVAKLFGKSKKKSKKQKEKVI